MGVARPEQFLLFGEVVQTPIANAGQLALPRGIRRVAQDGQEPIGRMNQAFDRKKQPLDRFQVVALYHFIVTFARHGCVLQYRFDGQSSTEYNPRQSDPAKGSHKEAFECNY